jgi:hypothetical protein
LYFDLNDNVKKNFHRRLVCSVFQYALIHAVVEAPVAAKKAKTIDEMLDQLELNSEPSQKRKLVFSRVETTEDSIPGERLASLLVSCL